MKKNSDFDWGRPPDWDALAAEVANERCAECGEQATTRCVGIPACKSCALVMYLCESCAQQFMDFIASGCTQEYDPSRYRLRSEN